MNFQRNNKLLASSNMAPQPSISSDIKDPRNAKSSTIKSKSLELLKKLKVKKIFCKISNKISNIIVCNKDVKFDETILNQNNEEKRKKALDNLMDDLMAKLKRNEIRHTEEIQLNDIANTVQSTDYKPIAPLRMKKRSHAASPKERPLKSSLTPSARNSINNEIESVTSSLSENTSKDLSYEHSGLPTFGPSTNVKPIAPPRKKKRSHDASRKAQQLTISNLLLTSSPENSDTEESESGISSLSEATSNESLDEYCGTQKYEIFSKYAKTERKIKVRRTCSWVKQRSLLDMYTICAADSEKEFERVMYSPKKSNNKRQLFFP